VSPEPKLSAVRARKMRRDREYGVTYAELARRYGVSVSQARAVCIGRYWKDAGGPLASVEHTEYERAPIMEAAHLGLDFDHAQYFVGLREAL
jgi:transposase-like protein